MLRVGAMVTYLRLCLHFVKEFIELVNVVMGPLSEHPHNLVGILVNICDLGALRATLLSNQGILSRSFSLSDWGRGLDKGALARQAVRQLGTVTRASDPQPVGVKSSPNGDDRGAQSSFRGESYPSPSSKAGSWIYLELGGGRLVAEIIQQTSVLVQCKSK